MARQKIIGTDTWAGWINKMADSNDYPDDLMGIPVVDEKGVVFTGKVVFRGKDYWRAWVRNGMFHRELGPAIISFDSYDDCEKLDYYINDVYYDENDYWKLMYQNYKGTRHEPKILVKLLAQEKK